MAVLDHDPVLKEKAKQKQEQVQHFIRSVERACEQNLEEETEAPMKPTETPTETPTTLPARSRSVELAGSTQAEQALPELRVLAEQQADRVVASNAVTVLAELGPCALTSTLVPRVLELFEESPGPSPVAGSKVHAWGGECREQLCNAIVGVNHNGGHLLVEVLLQMINRCDFKRQQRAAKVLTGCFGLAEAKEWMYTNDSCVLVELLLREIPAKAEDPKAFHCFSNCVKALLLCSQAAATHRRSELWQVMDDLRQDDRLERSVRQDCVEVLEDWFESMKTKLWIFPRGMARDGGVGEGSLQWTSKYGSVVASSYDIATTDGINEAGLVGNVLYLAEAQYGTAKRQGQKKISMGAMLQHILDNFGTVREAVDFNRGASVARDPLGAIKRKKQVHDRRLRMPLVQDNLCVIAPDLPNGEKTTVHVSISDAKNDSAVFEYIDGQLRIHHGSEYRVMTNSPPYDRQVALANYWTEIGGYTFLPGTHRAADRFARLSYNLHAVPKVNQSRQAVATVFSLMRHISVPLGITEPCRPKESLGRPWTA
eukprot:g30508.t1